MAEEKKTNNEDKEIKAKPSVSSEDPVVKEGKFFALVGYLGPLCLIPLLLKKDNQFALFHGKQALILFIFEVGCSLINIIPIIGQIIWMLSVLVFGIASLVGIVQVLMGNYWKVPVISDIAEKISI